MSSSSPSNSIDNIQVYDITVKSPKIIALIRLSIESTFQCDYDLAKGRLREITLRLAPAMPSLPFSAPLIVKVRLDGLFQVPRFRKFEINRQDLLSSAGTVNTNTNKREYRTTVDGIEVTVGFILVARRTSSLDHAASTDLRSTTDVIFDICPRFRVLVIGRTGAGKTSLIKNTFGVTDALISHGEVGECDINKELSSSDENKRFVLHDSKGFEPGDEGNFDTVMKFLNDRKVKPEIKDQVHAVWLCFSIPIAGDRLFETGAENFLRLLSDKQLGTMPIIAIFTKYDQLVDHIRIYDSAEGLDENAVIQAKLNELCIRPFRDQIGGRTTIPDIAVSTEEGYKWTLHDLTRLTTERVGDYLTEDVAVLSAVAQQVSPTVKLKAVIDVGRKRYWQGLASTINLPGNEPAIVLQNIHQDIVRIWNLRDPKELLDSKEFKEQVAGIVCEQDVLSIKEMATSLSMLGALAGIVSALSGPAAPIVIPIAAVLVVGHWTVLLFKQAGIVLQRLMNYIVALTLVMQTLFAITTSTNNIVSRRSIKLALKAFLDSSQKQIIHSAIKQHLQRTGSQFDRDGALQKISELINSNSISPNDMTRIKTMMKDFDVEKDEPWVTFM